LEQLRNEIKRIDGDDLTLHNEVEKGVENLNSMQELRLYCSEVVGMLREKEEMMSRLREVTLQTMVSSRMALQKQRCDEQEDVLFRIREVGELISLGVYQPSAILLEADPSVETGRYLKLN
jgi:hypothetical protein